MMQLPPHQPYYQVPVQQSYPTAAVTYSLQQPSVHAAYMQQHQPHPLATPQFTSVPALSPSHQISQQVMSPVDISSPTHLLQQPVSLTSSWGNGSNKIITHVSTGPRP